MGAVLLCPVGAELLTRGALHGALLGHFHVQLPWGRLFLSVPTMVAAVVSTLLWSFAMVVPTAEPSLWATALAVLGALVLGLACGIARERWRSLLPPIVLHVAAAAWAGYLPSLGP